MKSFFSLPKNVYLLFCSQVLGMSATSLIALTGGIIGAELAPSRELATLPATSLVMGLVLSTIPASLFMKRFGRRKGFFVATGIALGATILATFSLLEKNFFLFCFSVLLIGLNNAFLQQYRFAAIESVLPSLANKAASLVLFAGVFSGILGPEIAKRTKDFSDTQYAGSFLVLSLLYIIVLILLSFIKDPKPQTAKIAQVKRPLGEILRNPHFFISVLAGAVGFGIMSFIMTATPLHLHTVSHHSIEETAFVIQSHIIAMFLPSLVTGLLVEKFGVFRILLAGLGSFLLTVVFDFSAVSIPFYWVGLVLLGIGWNFLFFGATMLLARSYTSSERFKAQGVNDFLVMFIQLMGTFLAGKFLFTVGWDVIQLITLPIIFFAFIIFILFKKQISDTAN